MHSQIIPYREGRYNGILQNLLKIKQRNKFAIKVTSNVTDENREPEQILKQDDIFYASDNYDKFNENYIIIGFKNRIIYPTGYVIRSCKDFGWLRSWKVECSMLDLYDYIELHSENDTDILKNYQWFPLNGGPCRYIKVKQTGVSEGLEIYSQFRMRVSYLDFFGIIKPIPCLTASQKTQSF